MPSKAVVFDLFGTLVAPFSRSAHVAIMGECARALDVGIDDLNEGWSRSYPARISGELPSVEANFAWICQVLGLARRQSLCHQAAAAYREFTTASLAPLRGVLDALESVAAQGVAIGLLSNCAPDVPDIFRRQVLSRHFGALVFSCEAGVVKPHQRAYELVLSALGAGPEEAWYIGDGSDGELAGAAAAGLYPVLVTPTLDDTYDHERAEVRDWRGPRYAGVPEAVSALTGSRL